MNGKAITVSPLNGLEKWLPRLAQSGHDQLGPLRSHSCSANGDHGGIRRWQNLFYYDRPNDRDPHLIIDSDLRDGIPEKTKASLSTRPGVDPMSE